MANEFVVRNGLIAQDNSQVTGSLIVTNGITGSLEGTASQASNANLLDGFDSSNFTLSSSFNSYTSSINSYTQSLNAATGAFVTNSQTGSYATKTEVNAFTASINSYTSSLNAATSSFVRNSQTSSFVQNSQTGSFATFTALNAYTSSINSYTSSLNSATSSFVRNSQTSSFVQNSQTSSFVQNSQTGSFATFTALNAYTSSINSYTSSLNSITSSFATTGSNTFVGTQVMSNNGNYQAAVSGTAAGAYTQLYFDAGRDYGIGVGNTSEVTFGVANKFFLFDHTAGAMRMVVDENGNMALGNGKATPNAKLDVSGSTNITGSVGITGSLTLNGSDVVLTNQTSSFVLNSQTSSFVQNSQTSSFVLNSQTSSFVQNSQTSSFVLNSQTSSFVQNSQTSSFVQNSQTSSFVQNSQTGSFATFTALNAYTSSTNAFTASILSYTSSLNSRTSSFATTGSNNFIGTQNITGSLNVSGSINANVSGTVEGNININSGTEFARFFFRGSDNNFGIFISDTNASQTKLRIAGSTGNMTLNESSGDVSIGKTTANAKLDISGSTIITGSLTVSGSVTSTGTLTAQTLVVQTVSSSIIYSSGSNTFGNSLANNQVLTGSVIVTGSLSVNGSNAVLVNQTSSFATFTALNAYTSSTNAFSASILSYTSSLNSRTSSFATTGSNTFNGNQIITGSLTVGSGSLGVGENTLVLGPPPAGGSGEGGQMLLSAAGGTFNSASMLDNYQNRLRFLRGTNAGSDAELFNLNLHNGQFVFNRYTGSGAFSGTAAANLAVDSSGNVITVATGGGGGGSTDTGSLATTGSNIFTANNSISGSLNVSGTIYQGALTAPETRLTGYGIVVQGASAKLRVGPNYTTGGDRDYIDLLADGTNSRVTTNNENFSLENREPNGNISLVTSGSGNVNVTGSLRVSGSTTITGSLNVTGSTSITGTTNVTGALNVSSTAFVDGQLTVDNNIRLTGNAATYVYLPDGGSVANFSTGNTRIEFASSSMQIVSNGSNEMSILSTGVRIGNIVGDVHTVTGSLIVSGSTLSQNGSNVVLTNQTGSLTTFTAFNSYTSSINAFSASINLFTASINSYTASNNTTNTTQNNRIAGLESYTSSLNSATSSFVRNNQTSSFVLNSQTSSMSVLSAASASNITNAITNAADNRVLTANGGGTINGEANLTYNGTTLQISNEGTFNTTTPGTGLYGLHFTGQNTADYANGLTWNGGSSGAQAGIYVQGSGAYGTKMYFATTDAYVSGAKTAMSIDHTGVVLTTRNYLQAAGSLRAPIFYDSDNTGFYLDPNSTSNLYRLTVNPGTTGVATGLYVNGGDITAARTSTSGVIYFGTGGSVYLYYDGSSYIFGPGASYVQHAGSFRAPIFYDSDNTSYYVDPASTSNLVGLTVANTISGTTSGNVLSKSQSNWLSTGIIDNVIGLMAWKNYGNNHVIFDASNSTNPSGGACSNSTAAVAWTGTYPTLMGWNGSTTYGVRVDSARVSDSAGAVDFANLTNKGSGTGTYTTSGDFRAPIFYDSDNTGYYINPNGSSNLLDVTINALGVGTAAPGTAGLIRATNDVVAYYSSDKRLKDNIKLIENPLEKISKIGGYEFDWNDKQEVYEGHDIGIIAQEIEEILPEIVTTRDSGYKAVKYEKIVPLLIEGIKEQQQQINELKELVNKLINK